MKKYMTLSFKDNAQGRKQMGETIERMTKQGWEVKNADNVSHGYNAGKTIALGALFLPLALLGRKGNTIELVMEKEITDEDIKKQEQSEKFMESEKVIIPVNANNSVNCPMCKTNIKDYTERWGIFSKTKIYKCPKCGMEIQK